MKEDDHNIDQLFNSQAQGHLTPPDKRLWNELETRLDKKTQIFSIKNLMKIAAVLTPLIFAVYFILPRQGEVTHQVVDLSHTSTSDYYSDYRDFIQSRAYTSLLENYKGLR